MRLSEKVKLPSNGVLYGKNIPTEVTVREMLADEEACLYGSSRDKAITEILNSVIEEDFDVDQLIIPDKHFLLVRARMLTYGTNYPLEINCNRCGNFQYDFDLNDLVVNELDPAFEAEREIELPRSKRKITLKIPTGEDLNNVEKEIKRKVMKFNLNEDKVRYVAGLVSSISKIDGEDVFFDEAYQIVSDLSGYDISYLKKEINKVDVGYDTIITVECPKCGQEITLRLPMTADFFRAEFKD